MAPRRRTSTVRALLIAVALVAALFPLASPALSAEPPAGPEQRVIVKYRGGRSNVPVNANFRAIASAFGKTIAFARTTGTGADVLKVGGPRIDEGALTALAARLASDPQVEYAEVDRMLRPTVVPNDSQYGSQWHYHETTGGIRLPEAWNVSTGSGVVVGVVDTGYRPHADLAGNIVGGYDFISDSFTANDGEGVRDADAKDPGDWTTTGECGPSSSSSWHGTHVAGTVGAVTNNSAGVAGVAYGAKVLPLRALGRCGGYYSDIADAMVWGSGGAISGLPANAHPAKVLNLSLGGDASACSATLQSAIDSARSRGSVVVVSAGNSGVDGLGQSPGNCSGIINVAATDRNGARAGYSNYGTVVDIAAPGGGTGGGVLSTLNSGSTTPGSDTYAYFQGTSMAAPHVAGAAALLLSKSPTLSPDQVENTLKSTARAFPATCSGCGTGIVNASAALAGVVTPPPTTAPPTTTPPTTTPPSSTVLQNGVAVTALSGAQGSLTQFTMPIPSGRQNLTFKISGGTGDADLYVRFGAAPTTSSYNCRPYLSGNTETCTFSAPQTGTYYVMVRAYQAYSGVTLVGSHTASTTSTTTPPPTTTPPTTTPPTTTPPTTTAPGGSVLQNGVAITGLSGTQGSQKQFTLPMPSGRQNLTIKISGGTGDADLYVRFGAAPTTSSYNCRPFRSGNIETCTFSVPQTGTYYVMLRGYLAYSGVTLVASYT